MAPTSPTSNGAFSVQVLVDGTYFSTVFSRRVEPFPPMTYMALPSTAAAVLPRAVSIADLKSPPEFCTSVTAKVSLADCASIAALLRSAFLASGILVLAGLFTGPAVPAWESISRAPSWATTPPWRPQCSGCRAGVAPSCLDPTK